MIEYFNNSCEKTNIPLDSSRIENSKKHYLVLWVIPTGEEENKQYMLLHKMGNEHLLDMDVVNDIPESPEDLKKIIGLE